MIMSKYYVIDRSNPKFWEFNRFDDYVSALSYKKFLESDLVTVTGNKKEIIQLQLYCKVKNIPYFIVKENE